MDLPETRQRFKPAVDEILEQCRIADAFIDKELFQVYIATVWGNAALDPGKSGIEQEDLPILHDFLGEELGRVVGAGHDVRACYAFLMSDEGERSLLRLSITQRHKEFLQYFARLILQGGELPPGLGV